MYLLTESSKLMVCLYLLKHATTDNCLLNDYCSMNYDNPSLHSYISMCNLADFRGGFPGLRAGVGILRGAQSTSSPAVFGEQEGDPTDSQQTRPQPPPLPQPGVEARCSCMTKVFFRHALDSKHMKSDYKTTSMLLTSVKYNVEKLLLEIKLKY